MDSPKSTRELLEKYWAAETTPEEETQLRAQMRNEGKGAYGAYFRFLDDEAAQTMTAETTPVGKARVLSMRRVLSLAASVLVLVAAGFLIQRNMIGDMQTVAATGEDSFEDPEKAYEEARQALMLVSAKMNKSTRIASEQLAKTQPYIEIIK